MKYIPAIAVAALFAGFAAVGPTQAAPAAGEALKTQQAQPASVVEKTGWRKRKWHRHHRWYRNRWWRPRHYWRSPRYYRGYSHRHHRWHRRHHHRRWWR